MTFLSSLSDSLSALSDRVFLDESAKRFNSLLKEAKCPLCGARMEPFQFGMACERDRFWLYTTQKGPLQPQKLEKKEI